MDKRLNSILLLILILFLVACSNDAMKPGAGLENSLEATMRILTSKELKGRLTGTEGNEKAILYIENRFKEIGLAPYTGESYFHEYEQTFYHPDEQHHSIIVEYEDGSTEELKLGIDYMYRTLSNNNEIKLPVTFDINDAEISEKIVVLDKSDDISKVIQKSKGVLIKSESFFGSTRDHKSPYSIIDINDATYEKMLSKKAKTVNIKSEYKGKTVTAKNVIGKIPGKNNKKAVVLSAHFDHVGWAGETVFYGAVDNASGTTVLLDVAERLKKHSDTNPFDMDVLICAFNGEEFGLLGSMDFANYISSKYEEIYNINIDCVGSKTGGKIALDNENLISKELIEEIKISLDKNSIEYVDMYYGMSDHQSFVNKNICGVTIGQENLDGIHTPKDTIDDIDFEYLQKISDAVFDFVVGNDGKAFKPLNNTSKDNKTESIDEDGPSHETWGKAFEMAEQIKEDQEVQYDEAFYFMLDDYLFHSSGNKPLDSAKEVNNYYPDIKFPEKISRYKFKNIGISEKGPSSTMGVGCIYEPNFKGEIGKKYKREINPDNIWNIQIKYADKEYTIDIKITNRSMIRTTNSFLVKTKLDGDKKGYYTLKEKETDNFRGFGIDYNSDGNSYEIQVERCKENVSVVMGTSNRKYSNSEEDIINLIEELDLKESIEKIINELGI